MSLVSGVSLSKAWHGLTAEDKRSICDQLGVARSHLMRLRQSAPEEFVGKYITNLVVHGIKSTKSLLPQRNRIDQQRATS